MYQSSLDMILFTQNMILLYFQANIDHCERLFSGYYCKCICKRWLQKGYCICLTCAAGISTCYSNILYLAIHAFNSPVLNNFIVQLGLILGLVLSVLLLSLLPFASRLFTNDNNVLQLISIGIPVSNILMI